MKDTFDMIGKNSPDNNSSLYCLVGSVIVVGLFILYKLLS